MLDAEMPDVPEAKCCEFYGPETEFGCECAPVERALRAWKRGQITQPMTADQRSWCVAEVRSMGDSTDQHSDEEFAKMDDRALAGAVLCGWQDYCRDKGLL